MTNSSFNFVQFGSANTHKQKGREDEKTALIGTSNSLFLWFYVIGYVCLSTNSVCSTAFLCVCVCLIFCLSILLAPFLRTSLSIFLCLFIFIFVIFYLHFPNRIHRVSHTTYSFSFYGFGRRALPFSLYTVWHCSNIISCR